MKIYDISQEVFGCSVYPGDPIPQKHQINSIKMGGLYNLTSFSMCAHNGTHVDAPLHFLENRKSVDKIDLEKTIGCSYVTECKEDITAEVACGIIDKAKSVNLHSAKRILIKGNVVVTEDGARIFAENDVWLLGVESQSVGPIDSPMEVHKILLQKETVLLEGIRLTDVHEGVYFLNAAPLNLGGCEGSPCRAVLIDFEC